MSKTKKMVLRIVPIMLVLMLVLTTKVFGANPINSDLTGIDSTQKINAVTDATYKMWGTVVVILQIAAIGAIIFAGVRYMFASADTKADIKKQMVILVVGAVLVFGATTVASIIQTATQEFDK